ncbi:MAG TPA: ribonuclease R, partial [Eubacteriaceae bacterium]|nr:ribonuclease R [Eubacteriaceae bacterium]
MKFQEIILKVMKEEQYKPLGYKEMLYLFDVTNKKEKKQFKKTLDELLNQGKIVKNKKGKYKLAPEGLYVSGTLQGHAKGFGFVIPDA